MSGAEAQAKRKTCGVKRQRGTMQSLHRLRVH